MSTNDDIRDVQLRIEANHVEAVRLCDQRKRLAMRQFLESGFLLDQDKIASDELNRWYLLVRPPGFHGNPSVCHTVVYFEPGTNRTDSVDLTRTAADALVTVLGGFMPRTGEEAQERSLRRFDELRTRLGACWRETGEQSVVECRWCRTRRLDDEPQQEHSASCPRSILADVMDAP